MTKSLLPNHDVDKSISLSNATQDSRRSTIPSFAKGHFQYVLYFLIITADPTKISLHGAKTGSLSQRMKDHKNVQVSIQSKTCSCSRNSPKLPILMINLEEKRPFPRILCPRSSPPQGRLQNILNLKVQPPDYVSVIWKRIYTFKRYTMSQIFHNYLKIDTPSSTASTGLKTVPICSEKPPPSGVDKELPGSCKRKRVSGDLVIHILSLLSSRSFRRNCSAQFSGERLRTRVRLASSFFNLVPLEQPRAYSSSFGHKSPPSSQETITTSHLVVHDKPSPCS